MTYKSILLAIGVPQFEGDVKAAAELCLASDAHLTVMLVEMATLPPMRAFAANSAAWLYDPRSELEELGKVVSQAREYLNGFGISFDVVGWHTESMWLQYELGERARFADIALIGPSLKSDERLRRSVIEGLLFHSGRPILLASNLQTVSLQPRRILLAWNSSVESARATREALEMMAGADCVNVVQVDPEAVAAANGEEPRDIVSYLARHGIKATVDRLPGAGRRIEEVLSQHALDTAANLIVMGAYGHSRVREKVFGGVTQAMISAPVVPVMMLR